MSQVNSNTRVPAAILSAAVSLLKAYHPALTEQSLETALRTVEAVPEPSSVIEKPMTRRQVAEIFSVTVHSINRWMNKGTLKRIKIGANAVRIDAASVKALLKNGIEEVR